MHRQLPLRLVICTGRIGRIGLETVGLSRPCPLRL